MAEEFNAFLKNDTWEHVPRTPSMHVVGCKWLYKIKYALDGSVDRYKARLVALGNHQRAGIDYHETFSLVVKASTVRLILSIVVSCNWMIRRLDMKNAFLYGYLDEVVFMKLPPGFVHPQFPNHVCRLKKFLHGLKQAPHAWFHRFSSFLLSRGFICSRVDSSIFFYRHQSHILILLLYVDYILLTSNNTALINSFIATISTHFAMKDLGDLHYLIGVVRTLSLIHI